MSLRRRLRALNGLTIRAAIGLPALYLFPKRRLSGFRVIFSDLTGDREQASRALSDALATLRTNAPRSYESLTRYARRLVVWAGDHAMAQGLGIITLPTAWLGELSPEQIASVFVHELTHLRVSAFGVRQNQHSIARIERLCVRQQAAFLRNLGVEGQSLAESVEHSLESEWWTDEAHNAGIDALVERSAIPRWLGSLLKRR